MTRRTMPITTLRAGDRVTIHLTGRSLDRTHTWAGTVTAVDGRAVRIDPNWYRFTLAIHSARPGEEVVIPWSRIEAVTVHEPAGSP